MIIRRMIISCVFYDFSWKFRNRHFDSPTTHTRLRLSLEHSSITTNTTTKHRSCTLSCCMLAMWQQNAWWWFDLGSFIGVVLPVVGVLFVVNRIWEMGSGESKSSEAKPKPIGRVSLRSCLAYEKVRTNERLRIPFVVHVGCLFVHLWMII